VTEWDEFTGLDWKSRADQMKGEVVVWT
jgi:hypothetical protein